MLKRFLASTSLGLTLGLTLIFAACGGGGGSGSGSGPLPIVTSTPPTTTSASGTVVSDTDGTPLAGVHVALRPWAACSTPTPTSISCPTPLPAPQATTAANGTFTLTSAPNGHYFLTIGDDTPGSTTTTVHDNVTLSGGTVTLLAPTLPPVPTITATTWETNGDYRIQTLDANLEAPCFTEFNLQRAQRSLPRVIADEWLIENIRAFTKYVQSGSYTTPPWPGNANGALADTVDGIAGGSSCAQMVDSAFGNPRNDSNNALTVWYGGYYDNSNPATVAGRQQELPDPATRASTVGVVWP